MCELISAELPRSAAASRACSSPARRMRDQAMSGTTELSAERERVARLSHHPPVHELSAVLHADLGAAGLQASELVPSLRPEPAPPRLAAAIDGLCEEGQGHLDGPAGLHGRAGVPAAFAPAGKVNG